VLTSAHPVYVPTSRATPLPFPIEGVCERGMEESSLFRRAFFSSLFRHIWPICRAILRIHGGRSGWIMFFFSPFIFFFFFAESTSSSPLQTYELERPSEYARVFCAKRARKRTKSDSPLSCNYRDEGAWENRDTRVCRRVSATRREPGDCINQTTIADILFIKRRLTSKSIICTFAHPQSKARSVPF